MRCFLKTVCAATLVAALVSCGLRKQASSDDSMSMQPIGPAFIADSAFQFCQQQCDFGPRTMNSEAHEQCGQWIVSKFQQYGMTVTEQKATLTGFDGTKLQSTNIIASYLPSQTDRILLCAHWDSRPWADNDPDEANRKKPVLAANDGASGVAVMLEIARLLSTDSLKLGVDFVCFDAAGLLVRSTGLPIVPVNRRSLIVSASCSIWLGAKVRSSIRSNSPSTMRAMSWIRLGGQRR